jgi:hypothetical protein
VYGFRCHCGRWELKTEGIGRDRSVGRMFFFDVETRSSYLRNRKAPLHLGRSAKGYRRAELGVVV